MASILTNASALTALRNLANTQGALSKTQSQISTGLKVASASDNTTNWSVSTQIKTDNSVVNTIKDTLKQNSDLVNTASSAMDNLLTTIDKIKVELAKAKDVKDDNFDAINTSLAKLGAELDGVLENAALNGVNLLDDSVSDMDGGAAGKQIKLAAGWSGGTTGSGFKTINVDLTDLGSSAAGALTAAGTNASTQAVNSLKITGTGATAQTLVDNMAKDVETALKSVRNFATELGAAKNQIDAQSKFLGALGEAMTNSVSTLVDADMNEVSTRLQALQTQQQLGVQSLSIANQNSQMILRLFQ
ncbi:flagellin [Microvirga lotononidis]|uniref:Flagellin n=1 Tax=Microvirga lotononidis TaxID=864069 RepID=I4YLQ7_9HYPH|nr:flagellin [Microvirga lotononidis]EIM24899.1 flagellin/flagellar hook associated protein [Microvirga lotononidis]WQO29600.1 flagellin [Microvirga lotononidis]